MFINLIRGTLRPGSAACVSITVDTVSENVTYSENESFTVNAGVLTGSTPITYQWQRKYPLGSFTNISGATSANYTESSGLTSAQSGTEYRCNVSNACSSTTSRVITVTVLGSGGGPGGPPPP